MPIKERTGVVVSNKMDKTAVVSVVSRGTHGKYGKIVCKTKLYKVHDETNICSIGDLVTINESKPLSKTKRWILAFVKQKTFNTNSFNCGD
ncbi:ribosomal protein S17 (plastid) [Cryptomonas paramecium]|uniref:Small ribosomal subunit protein uS17c n=1 Tax=Cryptomonas paramaecium TaxID=2898 RepID=D2ISA3_9CRYP|nr:ribosomal protein S17 [Cryptomonas paramecium]ACT46795.1 ribosomal protein S17 [Cryptomonas paramecium]BDA98000.1 ribosomal protein S17 [Cryptomonas paramecium]